MNQLRDYQQEMLSRLSKAWKRNRSVMVQMPTGTGKTHLMAAVIREAPSSSPKGGGPVLVVAHRRELLEQIKQTLAAFGLTETNVKVESIQKLSKHIDETDFSPSLVVVDEAHHALAKTYRVLWDKWPKAKFLGLTATPCRLNGATFTDLFDVLLQSWTIQEFIDKGWLSDFVYVSASPNSEVMRQVRSLKKRGMDGDYQTKELATVMDVPESIEHLYNTYHQFANGKKGIVYAIDREHALHIAEYYKVQGVNCAVIDAKTAAEERRVLVVSFQEGGLKVLVNVDIFSEGFDCPEVEFIQLARPTLSLSKYLQQVGRGMRVSKGKPHVLILDNVGLYQTFGLPTEERDWSRTFYGKSTGKGDTSASRYVVLTDDGRDKELVNLEMVRIKKGGRKRAGLEIYLKDGRYGVMNGGKITCPARFKEIVRLEGQGNFFAAGIYSGRLYDVNVEYASLIDRRGMDMNLKLFRDVKWIGDVFYSYYKPRGYKDGDWFPYVYWDPKGNCYYNDSPEFETLAGVEMAVSTEHFDSRALCHKLRCSTGDVSPHFHLTEVFYNRDVIIARDYFVVKKDHNHAYRINAFLPDSVLVRMEGGTGFQQFFTNGSKGQVFKLIPSEARRSVFQVKNMLGLKRLWSKDAYQ